LGFQNLETIHSQSVKNSKWEGKKMIVHPNEIGCNVGLNYWCKPHKRDKESTVMET
jgi:hypothetical protein